MGNIILIEGLIAVLYLLMKKCAIAIWDTDKNKFLFIRHWYHWFEYMFVFVASVLTPMHSVNESIITICVVVIIKIIFDRTKFLDAVLHERFRAS